MKSRALGAATFFLSLQLLAATSAHAQGQQPPTPPKARPSDSSIAHNVITWFNHVIGSGAHRHRIVSSPPLPRPRPAQLTKAPAELPAAAVEQNKTPAVEPNEAQPAAAAVEPNTMSPAHSFSVEPDKSPAVELNDARAPKIPKYHVMAIPASIKRTNDCCLRGGPSITTKHWLDAKWKDIQNASPPESRQRFDVRSFATRDRVHDRSHPPLPSAMVR